jgi:succinoglycan biosynthesis transport protein ExoP
MDSSGNAVAGSGPPEIPPAAWAGPARSARSRRRLMPVILCECLLVGVAYLLSTPATYTSTARLYVEQYGPRILSENDPGAPGMTQSKNYLYTQRELLKSTPILAAALDKPGMRNLGFLSGLTDPLAGLQESLDVSVGKKDDIIRVSLDTGAPGEGARLVNAIVGAYVEYNAAQKRSMVVEVGRILQRELVQRRADLEARVRDLMEFNRTSGADLAATDKTNVAVQRLARLSEALTAAQIRTIGDRADYEAAKSMMSDPQRVRMFVEAQTSLGRYASERQESVLYAERNRLRAQRIAMGQNCTEDHPSIRATQTNLEQIERDLSEHDQRLAEAYLDVARQKWQSAVKEEAEIQATFEKQRTTAQETNAKSVQYALLQSDLQRSQKMCEAIDTRLRDLDASADTGGLNIRILEYAHPEDAPSSPNPVRVLAVAIGGGLALCLLLSLLPTCGAAPRLTPEQAAASLGLNVLGSVPTMPGADGDWVRGQWAALEPSSPAAGAFRAVSAATQFALRRRDARSLLVASPEAGDGRSTVVSNLAITQAQNGMRTLVIDAHFRRARQHGLFLLEPGPGLSGVLSGRASAEEAIRRTAVDRLDVLPAGAPGRGLSELLNSQGFADLLAEAARKYDRVLVDSPPAGSGADPRTLAAMCDATLVVLAARKVGGEPARRMVDELRRVGGFVVGAVINTIPGRKVRRWAPFGRRLTARRPASTVKTA